MGKYVKLRYRHRHSNSYQLMFFFAQPTCQPGLSQRIGFLGKIWNHGVSPGKFGMKWPCVAHGSQRTGFLLHQRIWSVYRLLKFFFLMSLLNTWNSSPKWSEFGNACLLGDMVFPCFFIFEIVIHSFPSAKHTKSYWKWPSRNSGFTN